MKRVFTLLLTLTLLVTMVACGGKKDDASTEAVLYSNGGPEEFFETPWLNPGLFLYNKVLYSRLIVADENLAPLAEHGDALAKSYSYSADGKTLTFELRDDIYWHDGEPVTGEDIKWSIEYASKTAVLNAVFKTTFDAIAGSGNDTFSGIKVDGKTIEITFEKIAPDALLTFTQFAPLPKKYFTDVDPLKIQQAEYFQSPVGSGPFKVGEVKMKDYTTLTAYDKYYNSVASFTIHLHASPGDSDTNMVKNAMNGNLDFAYTKDVADFKALSTVDKVTVTPVNVRYTRLLYVNKFDKKDGTTSPLADVRVRQAIRYAIDMEAIGNSIFNGSIIPANSLIPNEADKETGLEEYKFNPDKAKQLLQEANWDANYELDVVYYYTDQTTVDLMTAIQAYLSDVGIKMNFRLVEGDLATILWSAPADQVNGPSAVDWDLAYAANAALSLHEYYDRYQTGSTSNSHTPADEKLNSLIQATNASTDPDAQTAAFKALSKYENETLFAMALYYQPIFVITSDKVDLDLNTLGNPQFNYNWEIQKWELDSSK